MTAPNGDGGSDSADGSVEGQNSGLGGVIDDVAGAVAAPITAMIAPINTWLANIESGFAHFANVVGNNLFFSGVAVVGMIGILAGFYLLVTGTDVGGNFKIGKVAKKVATVAAL